MSVQMMRELFRNLENTVHERLMIIEELLQKSSGGNGSIEQSMQIQRPDPAVLDRLSKMETTTSRMKDNFETIVDTVNSLAQAVSRLKNEVSDMRKAVKVLEAAQKTVSPAPEEVQE